MAICVYYNMALKYLYLPEARQYGRQLFYLASCPCYDIKAVNLANKPPLTSISKASQAHVMQWQHRKKTLCFMTWTEEILNIEALYHFWLNLNLSSAWYSKGYFWMHTFFIKYTFLIMCRHFTMYVCMRERQTAWVCVCVCAYIKVAFQKIETYSNRDVERLLIKTLGVKLHRGTGWTVIQGNTLMIEQALHVSVIMLMWKHRHLTVYTWSTPKYISTYCPAKNPDKL